MKVYFHIMALVILACGFVGLWKANDLETFRYCTIVGMLFNIYAKVEDL